jgi:nicotinic acid mononucleotide adenylyltransferase
MENENDIDAKSSEKDIGGNTTDKKTPTKKVKSDKTYKNTIELNPTIEEAQGGTVVLGWGRMNPITTGHEKLVNKLASVAKQLRATPVIYLTHTQNSKKDPLEYSDKITLAQKAFGKIVQKSNSKTIIQVMQELQGKYKDVVLVVGADRIKEFDALLNKYNGKDYTFDSIKVVSAGNRADPDSEEAKTMTADAMSASVMRKLASEGDFEKFKKGLPKKLQANAQDVYDMVRGGMKIAEMVEEDESLDEAVLNLQQRRKRALMMRKYKGKIAAARRRMAKRPATKDRLQKRSRKAAIQIIRKLVAGKKGTSYKELSPAEKQQIDAKVAKKKAAVDRIAKRLMPKIKRADLERISSKNKTKTNEEFETFFETLDVAKQPRYHEARKKDGSIKLDGRFRAFRNKQTNKEETELQKTRDNHKDERERLTQRHKDEVVRAKRRDLAISARNEEKDIIQLVDEIIESIDLENTKVFQKLVEKSDAHNIPLRVIKNVYDGALQEDHDYDMSQQQYAFASLNVWLSKLSEEDKRNYRNQK